MFQQSLGKISATPMSILVGSSSCSHFIHDLQYLIPAQYHALQPVFVVPKGPVKFDAVILLLVIYKRREFAYLGVIFAVVLTPLPQNWS